MAEQAPNYDKRVTIQRNVKVDDGMGGQMNAGWQDFTTVWADVVPNNSDKQIVADGLVVYYTYRVTLRYTEGWKNTNGETLTPSPMIRLKWNGKTLKVKSLIDRKGEHICFDAFCDEIMADPSSVYR
jgi:SPP1 family predicted phage head-tail adaptor